MSVRLFWNKLCPWCHRVRIVALEKEIHLELKEVPIEADGLPQWFRQINPRGTIPTLQVGDRYVFESMIIAKYLDEAYPIASTLLPGDSETKYAVRFFCDEANRVIAELYEMFFQNETQAGLAEEIQPKVDSTVGRLELLLERNAADGPYFLGDHFSLADISVLPFLIRMDPLMQYFAGISLLSKAPRLRRMLQVASLRPSVASTTEASEFYLSGYQKLLGRKPNVPPLKLYVSPRCPFSQRVRITAALLGTPLELIEVSLPNPPPSYYAINPRGTTPTLEIRPGRFLHESALIMEYLCESRLTAEERRRDVPPPLTAASALDRAAARFLVDELDEMVDCFVEFKKTRTEEARDALIARVRNLERILARQESRGPFFQGKDITLPDVAMIPILFHAMITLPSVGVNSEVELPRLSALYNAALSLPAVREVIPTPGPPPASEAAAGREKETLKDEARGGPTNGDANMNLNVQKTPNGFSHAAAAKRAAIVRANSQADP